LLGILFEELIWETEKLVSYQALLEKLPDTLYWDTYFRSSTLSAHRGCLHSLYEAAA
jgi:hypothetical protein